MSAADAPEYQVTQLLAAWRGGDDTAVDARSDLWSFGVVFSEMLGDARPAGLQRLIERCLRKNPAERYRSADDLLVDLRAAQR